MENGHISPHDSLTEQIYAHLSWRVIKQEHVDVCELKLKAKPTQLVFNVHTPGPWFNIKMSSYQYRKSRCGDKTVVRSSYLHNGISYTGKIASLYWISPQGPFWVTN